MPKKPAKKIIKKTAVKPIKKLIKKPAAKPIAKKIAKKFAAKPAPKKPIPATNIKKFAVIRKPAKVTLPNNYKPSAKDAYMNDYQIEYFRQKLVKWKDELSQELKYTLDNLKEENWQEADMADRATVETDASLELRTRDRYRKLIAKINIALDKIAKGEYGYCEETGEEIGLKRLEARPIATLTIEAQERHERDERTHYDEDMEERLA
jgi:DnaK suppressor protein